MGVLEEVGRSMLHASRAGAQVSAPLRVVPHNFFLFYMF